MNDAAAPPRDEVRSHKVTGSLRVLKSGKETPVVTNEASKARRNEKAHASGSGDNASQQTGANFVLPRLPADDKT